ncbi:uncharacterized protein [Anabrus simplex]|uniref:uncharacterized protein n=1 Tax=Anabrus simplex TaxID=316456 RepID=UPI0035A3084E
MKTCQSFMLERTNNHQCSDLIVQLMDNLNCGEKKQKTVEFLKSQLQLCVTQPERHRFDSNVLIFASLLFFISAHAYKFLRSYGCIILPHPNTIRKLCGYVNVDPSNENFLSYMKDKVPQLEDYERVVTLMLDEIHLKPYLDYKGGNVVGMAYDTAMLATTAHVFMVQGVVSSLKDVVNILPVNKMTADKLFDVTKNVVVGLEKLGFKVICIITDNNSINRRAISNFANPPQMSIVYPHPAEPTRPLFFLIDAVHIFKCIRNNWINLKNDGCTFVYPDFIERDNTNYASFSALRGLFESESHKLLKFGYGLSIKAVWPSNLERQNVKLVMQVFSGHIANSLLKLGPTNNLQNYEGTAKFIEIINKWWSIVNVKTPLKGLRSREEMQKPLTNNPSDERRNFLKQFLLWLDDWENMNLPGGTLTKETHSALKLTTYGLIELAEYCLSELNMSYLLPGKFQTDALEARFGLYRRLSGSQYHVSVRQIFEAEKKLRLSSSLQLSLKHGTSSKLTISKLNVDEEDYPLHNDCLETEHFKHINVSETDLKISDSDLAVLTYVAGYCCYSILRKLKCQNCSEFLVLDKKLACGKEHELITELDRGGLKYPQELPVMIVMYTYYLRTF